MNYAAMAERAATMIERYGRPVTIRDKTYTADASDVADPSEPFEPDEQECEVAAVTLPVRPSEQYATGLAERSHQRRVLLAATLLAGGPLPFEPSVGDEIDFDAGTWHFKTVDPVAPDGTVLVYDTVVMR